MLCTLRRSLWDIKERSADVPIRLVVLHYIKTEIYSFKNRREIDVDVDVLMGDSELLDWS